MNSSMVYASNDDGQCNFLSLEAVKSEAVADANKLTLTVYKNPHFTKKVIYWRQWTLGVVK